MRHLHSLASLPASCVLPRVRMDQVRVPLRQGEAVGASRSAIHDWSELHRCALLGHCQTVGAWACRFLRVSFRLCSAPRSSLALDQKGALEGIDKRSLVASDLL
eukprot:CAMPEP_0175995320 /NCGR_PEP_ID=MMETSP0108-20121206/55066_1 /TAXON_ID=195067 ORGANISM="Goniomonas pacifica, Strain CCMP1869" /NCGR_SAMPLE_ID=MMETSP0108 /ASSEMBLY_ACC=CAM_ASM_000204 /LENGTH=103 /DNA_ID=CAMNT_0017327429 /DNA_START=28 /DNA_END=340 /DNA_ORIENTATION=-